VEDNDQRAAAVAFVRGSRTGKVVPEPEITKEAMDKMSDREFSAYTQKEYGI
jgi:hypothetical protein